MSLVSLELAKRHLFLSQTDTTFDDDVTNKSEQASAAVVSYMKDGAWQGWTSDTVPLEVQAAVLFYLDHLWQNRGGDMAQSDNDPRVWEAIGRLVARLRDPAIA